MSVVNSIPNKEKLFSLNKIFSFFRPEEQLSNDLSKISSQNETLETPKLEYHMDHSNSNHIISDDSNNTSDYLSPNIESSVDLNTDALQYEQFSKEFSQLSNHDSYDGFRVEAGKSVTKQLQSCHTLLLGTSLSEKGYIYQFGPTFSTENGSLILFGRYSNDGLMNIRISKQFKNKLEAKLGYSSSLNSSQNNISELSLEKTANNWASSFKAAWQGTWLFQYAFSQKITPSLIIGSDLTWISINSATIGSLGLRYTCGNHIFTTNLLRQPSLKSRFFFSNNMHTLRFQSFTKVSNRLSLGSELEIGKEDSSLTSSLRFAYEYSFAQSKVQGLIDSMGKISLIIQDISGFGLCGQLDYWRNDYKFGFMMQLLSQQNTVKNNRSLNV